MRDNITSHATVSILAHESYRLNASYVIVRHASCVVRLQQLLKETKSAFEMFYFLFKSFVKVELSYV